MNVKKIINDYVECNEFEIKIIKNKVKIYYYDKVEHFSSEKIIISKSENNYIVQGKCLVIETMFEEMIVISGRISSICMQKNNE